MINALGGSEYKFKEIWAVYNPALLSAFALQRDLAVKRAEAEPLLFQKKTYLMQDDAEEKQWVFGKYQERVDSFAWNADSCCKIIPGIQGTAASVAWKLAELGFYDNSSLDVGFYGKGIYFTSSMRYAEPYGATFFVSKASGTSLKNQSQLLSFLG